MKAHCICFITLLLGLTILVSYTAFSQTPAPPANDIREESRISDKPFAEERMAVQTFIERVNEGREELAMKQFDLAKQKIITARNLLPLIERATPAQRRLTRVEFGGGLYANDLDQRKNYSPIETQSLESLSRSTGPRWVRSSRMESDAKIIYIALDLSDGKAESYLDKAGQALEDGNIKIAQEQLADLTDHVIKVDDMIPSAVQARDYITLADNYILVGNFYGARTSLEKANAFLDRMKAEDTYKSYRSDIIVLHKNINDLQTAFAKLDADQIKDAQVNLKKWQQQLSGWACE